MIKTTETEVIYNLQKMIDKRYFSGAEINLESKKIIFNHTSQGKEFSSNRLKNNIKNTREILITVIYQKYGVENKILENLRGERKYYI